MRKPTAEDIETAIAWLQANEGEDGEASACSKVADWLGTLARDAYIRKAARVAGVPVAMVRAKLRLSR